jgi:hypothetical protein
MASERVTENSRRWLKITANFNVHDFLDMKLYDVIAVYATNRSIRMSVAAKELLARGLVYTRMTDGIHVRRGPSKSTLDKLTQKLEIARAIEDQEFARILEREVEMVKLSYGYVIEAAAANAREAQKEKPEVIFTWHDEQKEEEEPQKE